MDYVILYNSLADSGKGKTNAEKLSAILEGDNLQYKDITTVDGYAQFFAEVPADTTVILCGGDGTLNKFINNTADITVNCKLLYFPCGSGNDFAREVADGKDLIELGEYIKNLPVVTVNGKDYRFINGIGYGIDGYCCEVGDKLREKNDGKKINYTSIAIKGLLFHYHPTKATVIVDGKETRYKKVWLAPTMFGKYYGGGMIPTPSQSRRNPEGNVSVMVYHKCGKLKALIMFPSIFKGEHVKHEKHVTVLSGSEITVKFDKPRALQIDGETILNVTEYTVKNASLAALKVAEAA